MTPAARQTRERRRRGPGPPRFELVALALAVIAGLGPVLAGCAPGERSPVAPTSAPTAAASSVAVLPTIAPSPTAPSPTALAASSRDLPDFTVPPWPGVSPRPGPGAGPTRVVIRGLGIDLAIVVPPKRETFPLCNVAEYLRAFAFPGWGGTTYVYAHAREGMFLPILRASRRANGRSLLGMTVDVYTADDLRYRYEITRVRRFQKHLDWAFRLPAELLVLQTSETPFANGTKVMLVARLMGVTVVPHAEAHPKARPRRCS